MFPLLELFTAPVGSLHGREVTRTGGLGETTHFPLVRQDAIRRWSSSLPVRAEGIGFPILLTSENSSSIPEESCERSAAARFAVTPRKGWPPTDA